MLPVMWMGSVSFVNNIVSLFSRLGSRTFAGIVLVFLGFSLVYTRASAPYELLLVPGALAFLLTISGIVLMFTDHHYLTEGTWSSGAVIQTTDSADLEQVITQLSQNYQVLRRQTIQGFILASIFMALGLLVILAGSVGQLFGLTTQGVNIISISGMLTEFISATALYLYNVNFRRINVISDNLLETWKVLSAFRRAEKLGDKGTDVSIELIRLLVASATARPSSSSLSSSNEPRTTRLDN